MSDEARQATLAEALSAVPDPRREHLRVHSLVAIVQVAVAAMLCGARTIYAIAQWARERRQDNPVLLESLGVAPGRCPSHPTFHRFFKGVDAVAYEKAVGGWLASTGMKPREVFGIDGKAQRGIHGEEAPGAFLVSAYALHARAVIAQMACSGKGHELEAARELVGQLPLEGNVVIGDALLCQRDICQQVGDAGGDYVVPVKENQPTLHAEIERAFSPSGS